MLAFFQPKTSYAAMKWSRFSGQLFKHLQAASRSKSQGAIYPFLECDRRLSQWSSMYLNASCLASSPDLHLLSSIGSRLSVLKDDSATASSHGFPGLDIDWAIPCDPRRLRDAREAHRGPGRRGTPARSRPAGPPFRRLAQAHRRPASPRSRPASTIRRLCDAARPSWPRGGAGPRRCRYR